MPSTVSDVPILVAGMHRSGTSAVAGVLAGGTDASARGQSPGADFANPAGYGELTRIVDLDREALRAKGWFWDAPPCVPPIDDEVRPDLVESGRALMRDYLASSGGVFKDPRFSLVLPMWRRILVDRLIVVVPVRPVLEVAWSLAMRDGFSMSLGIALSNAYHRHLAAGLSGLPVVVVDYTMLVDQPAATIAQLVDALRELGAEVDIDMDAAITSVHPELRRTSVPADIRSSFEALRLDKVLPGMSTGPVNVFNSFGLSAAAAQLWESDILDEHRLRRREQAEMRKEADEQRQRSERDIATYAQSTSWRVTAPARNFGHSLRHFRPGRRGAQAAVDAREVALDALALTSVVGLWPLARASRGYQRVARTIRRPKPDRS